jgi:FkbM family methyltransferase
MKTNTRLLFKFLLRRCNVDCIFDIGSCDGYESCLFRQVRPEARVIAFEANPFLYKKMLANPEISASKVEVLPFAISNKKGVAHFHVTDVNYDDAQVENPGTSSLLVHEGLKVKEVLEVPTRRIDEFLLSENPQARNVALWIDAEGAEYEVLEGMDGIKDRVVTVHVETARTAMRQGQKVYSEVQELMKSLGFITAGDNMFEKSVWGDAVFVRKDVPFILGFRYYFCRFVGWLSHWGRVNLIGQFLRKYCNPLYRLLSRLYLKLFS